MKENFDIFLIVMALLAAVVYAALHFFEAGYGYLFDRRYGPPVPNRVGWMVMDPMHSIFSAAPPQAVYFF